MSFLDNFVFLIAPLFIVSSLSISLIFILSVVALLSRNFQFFPPPGKGTWQHRTFLFLFRGYLYPLIGLTALLFEPITGPYSAFIYLLGSILFISGFGLAFAITFQMGWQNAFGEKLGLQTSGWFKWSRNPIYVVTWAGLVGWAVIANSMLVTSLLSIWAVMYLAAPFVEEPWLEKEYGEKYISYKKRTPRFV